VATTELLRQLDRTVGCGLGLTYIPSRETSNIPDRINRQTLGNVLALLSHRAKNYSNRPYRYIRDDQCLFHGTLETKLLLKE